MKILSNKNYNKMASTLVELQQDYNDLQLHSTRAIDGLGKTNNELCEEIRQLEETNRELGNELEALESKYNDKVKEIRKLKFLLTKNNIDYGKGK